MFTISEASGYSLFSGKDELCKHLKIAVIHLRNIFESLRCARLCAQSTGYKIPRHNSCPTEVCCLVREMDGPIVSYNTVWQMLWRVRTERGTAPLLGVKQGLERKTSWKNWCFRQGRWHMERWNVGWEGRHPMNVLMPYCSCNNDHKLNFNFLKWYRLLSGLKTHGF